MSACTQAPGSQERRLWRAGHTPHPGQRPSTLAAGAAQQQQGTLGGPLPLTESARRIAMALDSMIPVRPILAAAYARDTRTICLLPRWSSIAKQGLLCSGGKAGQAY